MDNGNNYDSYQYGNMSDEPTEVRPNPQSEEIKEEGEPKEKREDAKSGETQEDVKSEETSSENVTYAYSYIKPEVIEEPKKKKTGSAKKWILCIAMAIVFGLVASAVYQTSNFLIRKFTGYGTTIDKTVTTTTTKDDNDESGNKQLTDVSQVAANVMPSVVSITNLSVQEVQSFFFGGTTTQQSESTGSGIIVGQNDTELLIVSNNHVVEGSTTLTVSFVDGESVEAKIKGTDSTIDLAIISVSLANVQKSTLEEIKIATLGDSDELSVGEPAIAIGNALGYGQSVTYGIISAVNRQIEGYSEELIQTDAAINPGNSGGALLNQKGEVIGINTIKVSGNNVEGMGYAIPISDVNEIINELMNRETRDKVDEAKRGVLGISGIDVDETVTQYYKIPQGVYISEVTKGSGAEKAGIVAGSVIVKFGGTSVSTMEELQEQLSYYEAGETVDVVVQVPSENGGYVKKTYEVTLSRKSIFD